ncbi:MAG: metal/formaldehyde-sensitive transcriptional repressor [Caulobacterales bacterium]|nr:metal/formaldehyde-sensitive transcriptional repressor [Caulobacterales bacterium]
MSHFSKSKDALLKRVRRIAGQVSAIERALEADQDCAATLQLVAATKGAIGGLMEEILEDHLREHVAHPDLTPADRAQGAEELLAVIRRYAK